ncbi:hypothetical protein POM88_028298 [Heracleum sosnowskyi]|uniref:Uncharacterized protein n=1 Tax=Heracleum sosnowskyi TaxID=360622 RepID=A0AAD8IAM1_9APIA|nr:hypothetical protein POM88_028298 [Heracleum sosnowskyi]
MDITLVVISGTSLSDLKSRENLLRGPKELNLLIYILLSHGFSQVCTLALSAKFIPRKQWVVAGADDMHSLRQTFLQSCSLITYLLGVSPKDTIVTTLPQVDEFRREHKQTAGECGLFGVMFLPELSLSLAIAALCQDGVILGANTRATEGPIVTDKNCEKIHYTAPNIYSCGAGTAAYTEAVTDNIISHSHTSKISSFQLRRSRFSYFGPCGVDVIGPHLHMIYPHGSTDTLPFATMGSGSLAAMAVFESRYGEGMSRGARVALVRGAIQSGIFSDLENGSNVDICVITKGNKEYWRYYEMPNPRTFTKKIYSQYLPPSEFQIPIKLDLYAKKCAEIGKFLQDE